jgi:LysM repeat protein
MRTTSRSIARAAPAAALFLLATLAASPAAAQTGPCRGHTTVRDGDTLVSIAARCGVTVPALLALNPGVRDDEDLRVGRDVAVPRPRDPQPSPRQACGAFYTIRDGDTLAEIALKCGVTVPQLVAANGPLPHPLGLNRGRTVRIPDLPRAAVADTTTWVAPAPAGPPAPEAETEELTRVRGTLLAGPRCPMLRSDDGRTIALAIRPGGAFRPGDAVIVLGVPAPDDRCGHSPTLEPRILYRAEP